MSRLYINASNVLDQLNTKGGLKTLVFSSKIGGNKKKLYALVCETLKYKPVMDSALSQCKIKKRLMEMYRPNFLYVMLYDLIFGRGIEGGGKMKRELKKHEENIRNALIKIMKEKGVTKYAELLPDSIRNVVKMPRYARVNTLKGTNSTNVINSFQKELKEQQESSRSSSNKNNNFNKSSKEIAVPTIDEHVPHLILFPPGHDLHDHPMVENGSIILQDKASCLPAYILARALGFAKSTKLYENIDDIDFKDKITTCKRNNNNNDSKIDVIDACAAPGNKTSQMASFITKVYNHKELIHDNDDNIVNNTDNNVFAFDISPNRLNTLKKRMTEASATNVIAKLQSFLEVNPKDPLYKDVKAIMLDPSCSGSGMVNRLDHLMDMNSNKSNEEDRLNNLATFQLNALKHAFSFPNVTHVCYSTCSIHDIENENVVASALKFINSDGFNQPNKFELIHALPEWHRRGHPNTHLTKDESNCLVRCLGPDDMTNGFFVACFKRQENEVEKQKKISRNAKRREKRKRKKLKNKMLQEQEGGGGGKGDGSDNSIHHQNKKQKL
jgi:25S rRNA (cytosine2278-C5)-methyltransferase